MSNEFNQVVKELREVADNLESITHEGFIDWELVEEALMEPLIKYYKSCNNKYMLSKHDK